MDENTRGSKLNKRLTELETIIKKLEENADTMNNLIGTIIENYAPQLDVNNPLNKPLSDRIQFAKGLIQLCSEVRSN